MSQPTAEFEPAVDPNHAVDILAGAVESTDADAFDAFLTGRVGEYTRFADGRIHQPQDITEVQVMVRAVVDGHAARVAVSNLAAVPEATRAAAGMARSLAAAASHPGRTVVAEPSVTATRPETVLFDAGTAGFDTSARVALVQAAHQAATQRGGSVAGMIGRALTQLVTASSNGVRRSTIATEAQGGFTFAVADGTSHFIDLGRAVDRLRLSAAIDEHAALAAASAGRTELEPGEYTVVLGPEATAELMEFLPAFGFAGEMAAAGVGVCARAAGAQVASPLVAVADDALADIGLPIGFDIEGTPKRRVPFLDNGIVGSPVTDLATAAVLGSRSTGHAHIAREEAPATHAANIVMAAGRSTEAALIAGVDHGVYIQRFWYTRLVDRAASTITGVTRDACFEISGGALGRPLAGMRFTQSVLGLLATVDGVGDVQRSVPAMNVWNGSITAPAIRAHGFRLGSAPAHNGEDS
jgi:PmbA protein